VLAVWVVWVVLGPMGHYCESLDSRIHPTPEAPHHIDLILQPSRPALLLPQGISGSVPGHHVVPWGNDGSLRLRQIRWASPTVRGVTAAANPQASDPRPELVSWNLAVSNRPHHRERKYQPTARTCSLGMLDVSAFSAKTF
jgi:hypothetical protein